MHTARMKPIKGEKCTPSPVCFAGCERD